VIYLFVTVTCCSTRVLANSGLHALFSLLPVCPNAVRLNKMQEISVKNNGLNFIDSSEIGEIIITMKNSKMRENLRDLN
jgi:hypothetical protein